MRVYRVVVAVEGIGVSFLFRLRSEVGSRGRCQAVRRRLSRMHGFAGLRPTCGQPVTTTDRSRRLVARAVRGERSIAALDRRLPDR